MWCHKIVVSLYSIMNDIAKELAKLHELKGADFSRQVEHIAQMGVFHPLEDEVGIFTAGIEKGDDYENLMIAAHKAVEFGYRVFLLPNPREVRTADFIFEKKGVYRIYDLKTVYGKSSVGTNLQDSIGQCNRILLNIQIDYSTRLLTSDIKKYFETNKDAIEVLIFKGRKRISVNRRHTMNPSFYSVFKKMYEK